MAFWSAVVLLLICVYEAVQCYRAFSRGGSKILLAATIVMTLLSIAAILYIAAVFFFISTMY
jgi:predicted Co/Zn/Cd cation transporter (cation efflux family)